MSRAVPGGDMIFWQREAVTDGWRWLLPALAEGCGEDRRPMAPKPARGRGPSGDRDS
jgi:hypothetical protein